jgi:nicotinate dehydrogenase subunit A
MELKVNGELRETAAAADAPLLNVLRNDFRLNGPKFGCGLGQCGACSVLIDGVPGRSCVIPAAGVVGREITTLEGLVKDGRLHPVQQAFIDAQAAQCGYCLNGMVLAAKALLDCNPHPDEAQIRAALRYQLCRCGTHVEIMAAVRRAAQLYAQAKVEESA